MKLKNISKKIVNVGIKAVRPDEIIETDDKNLTEKLKSKKLFEEA